MLNINKWVRIILICIPVTFLFGKSNAQKQDWTHYVRTAGHGLSIKDIPKVIQDADRTHLFGIEVDNSITGRYETFLHPEPELKAVEAMADSAHAHHNHAFVYIAGLEVITNHADSVTHTLYRDHPDWVQRNRKGEPAVFGSSDAFWIDKGAEDVWVTPYAKEWKTLYMKRVRQIAATGIDGIYIDIPYWMTHFTGWEKTWASFDKYTVAAFKKATGINAMTDFKLGDWENPKFIAWVDFRIKSINDFIAEVKKNITQINPECKLILEIYPGLGEAVARVGSDNYQLSQIADVITHEYNPGGNSAKRSPLQWMQYMIAMYSFRAFAENKPTWMLSYSWDNNPNIQPADAMKNLFMSQVMAGANSWDAARFIMWGSNDYETRTQVYNWIKKNEDLIYEPRKNISPIAVYFSPKTRNYFTKEWKESYFGIMELLLQNHVEFEIVTPRQLNHVNANVLIIPNVKCLSEKEILEFKKLLRQGKELVVTGETGKYNHKRKPIGQDNPVDGLEKNYSNLLFIKEQPGKSFYRLMKKKYSILTYYNKQVSYRNQGVKDFLRTLKDDYLPAVTIKGADGCVTQIAAVNGKTTIFLTNFTGLQSEINAIPTPKRNISLIFNDVKDGVDKIKVIPFLGKPMLIKGNLRNGKLEVSLPSILRGAIIQLEQ